MTAHCCKLLELLPAASLDQLWSNRSTPEDPQAKILEPGTPDFCVSLLDFKMWSLLAWLAGALQKVPRDQPPLIANMPGMHLFLDVHPDKLPAMNAEKCASKLPLQSMCMLVSI